MARGDRVFRGSGAEAVQVLQGLLLQQTWPEDRFEALEKLGGSPRTNWP